MISKYNWISEFGIDCAIHNSDFVIDPSVPEGGGGIMSLMTFLSIYKFDETHEGWQILMEQAIQQIVNE